MQIKNTYKKSSNPNCKNNSDLILFNFGNITLSIIYTPIIPSRIHHIFFLNRVHMASIRQNTFVSKQNFIDSSFYFPLLFLPILSPILSSSASEPQFSRSKSYLNRKYWNFVSFFTNIVEKHTHLISSSPK